jgi:RNA polymerase sigma-70 factor (ECF subfamily)
MTAAREQILLQLRERIFAYAASRIGREDAEDLAQEVLVLLEQKYAALDRIEDLLPLSFQILRYKMADFRRKMVRRGEHNSVPVDGIQIADGRADHAAAFERRELQQRLETALGQLEARCRELFRMKLAGKSFAEIREAMGAASINTVYTWDFRCRKQLLERMGGAWVNKMPHSMLPPGMPLKEPKR